MEQTQFMGTETWRLGRKVAGVNMGAREQAGRMQGYTIDGGTLSPCRKMRWRGNVWKCDRYKCKCRGMLHETQNIDEMKYRKCLVLPSNV